MVKTLPSDFQDAFGVLFIRFRARFHPEKFTFVDHKLSVLTAKDLKAI